MADHKVVRKNVSRIAVWTNFVHVACGSDRTHLTFNDRHLSQDMVLDWLCLGAILKTHFVDYDWCVSDNTDVFLQSRQPH